MQTVIIEDEAYAVERLESLLLDIEPAMDIVARLTGVKESVRWLTHNSADLIFLDIQLSDGLGFSIFEQIHVHTPIIFTTAYDQYAIKAFKLNSIDYLLKPVRKSELMASLQKYKSLKTALHIDFDSLVNLVQGNQPAYKKRFMVQFGERIKKFDVEEIAYFYSYDKNTYLRVFNGPSFPVDFSLDKIESMLDPAMFFRINRKYIVNITSIQKMTAFSRGRIKLVLNPLPDAEDNCIVSVERSNGFKKWLDS